MDLREFVVGFIAESDELVSAANASLLEIEAANTAGTTRPVAVRNLFRALHTLKGLAGMIGVDPIVDVAHGLESLVRTADLAGGALGRDGVDVSLRGIAAIADCVRAVAEHRTPPSAPAELIDAIAGTASGLAGARTPPPGAANRAAGRASSWTAALSPAETLLLTQRTRSGHRAWQVSFVPSEANSARGITITSVRARLGALGEIIKVLPRATPSLPSGIAFDLWLTSDASAQALADAAATTAEQVVELTVALEPSDVPPVVATPIPPDDAAGVSHDESAHGAGLLGRAHVRVELTRLDELQDQLSLLIVSRFRLDHEIAAMAERNLDVRALREIAVLQGRQLRDLRRAILRARMVRAAEMLEPLTLLVRSLGRSAHKEVRLELDAREAELDKAVADRLLPALVHLVRNAVDHAIEPADERRARGKPPTGTVKVRCIDVGANQLELIVQDDGRGIDRRAIAARAGRAVEDDASLLDVLTSPGFSTRDAVTRTSGRGLGMDIVRRIATDDLGGELTISTTPGTGTAFTLRVPLTIAVVEVFSFVCGRQTFVVPVSSVDEIFELGKDQDVLPPAAADARAPFRLAERRGQAIPLRSLATLLALDGDDGARKAIVIRRQGALVGFTIDRMLGRHEVVVRPVDDLLVKVPGIAGSTDLGDGRPTLVLDLYALSAHDAERQVS